MKRVRFAPSPTGNLHIGSVRTALFNWLFAKNQNGKMILRIEDTDKTRSNKDFEEDILNGLIWLGLNWDEGPFWQTENLAQYQKYAKILLDKKLAYEKDDALFFKVSQQGSTVVKDLVRGNVVFENKNIKDQVIIKSDGMPTYNFAVVIDDYLLGITDVIRGEDHLPNTPKQMLIYEALGFKTPNFAHIPMILGTDRSKLSKRHGAVSVNEYKKQGFLAEAMVNFLALLGWTPSDGKEIMTIDELIARFSLDRVVKAGAIFDIDKLRWLNSEKLRAMDFERLFNVAKNYFPNNQKDDLWLKKALESIKDSLVVYNDITSATSVYFEDNISYEEIKAEKVYQDSLPVLEMFSKKIINSNSLDESIAQNLIDSLLLESKLSKKNVLHPIRFVLSARDSGPPLKYIIGLFGKEKVLDRLNGFLNKKWQ